MSLIDAGAPLPGLPGRDDGARDAIVALWRSPLITSPANPTVKAAAKLKARKGRRDAGSFMVEGPQAVREGLAWLTDLFVTPEAATEHGDLVADAAARGARLRPVTGEVMRSLADTVTPQGLVGVADLPQPRLEDLSDARFLVVLDGVRDPGNAGTIIRTADAAGADGVVFLQGGVDPFNPKAVRASTGSLFHLPVVTGVGLDELVGLRGDRFQMLAADVHASVPLSDIDLSGPTALVFGGEAHGISSAVSAACSVSVHVPIARPQRRGFTGHAESLNLAAAAAVMAFTVAHAQSGQAPSLT